VESFGSANCGTSWKRTLNSLISFSFLRCQLVTTPKLCHLHQRRNKPRSNKFSSLPLAYPEYLQLGMSEAAPGITFHQCQTNRDFQVASSGLYEPIREGFWNHQRSVSYPSVPAQRAVANHEFCSDYLSLRDRLGVLELVIWYKGMLTLCLRGEFGFDHQET
jgi:hypothetical protein